MTPYTHLKNITHHLLTAHKDIACTQTIPQLYQLFTTLTGLDAHATTSPYEKDTPLPSGMAISPHLAATCLIDYPYRTLQYLRGLKAAIDTTLTRFSQRPLHLLYAGCGPYAPLLLPLTTQFTAQQIQITLLDIHQDSLNMVQKSVQALSIAPYITAYHQMDATHYQHPPHTPLHLIVLEIMQTALHNEGQLPITLHLQPQLSPGGLLIPQNIIVDAFLSNDINGDHLYTPDQAPPHSHNHHLGTLLSLNAHTIPHLKQQAQNGTTHIAPTTIHLPAKFPSPAYFLLATTVQVYASFSLRGHKTGLTEPLVLHKLTNLAPNTAVHFNYQLGIQPQFVYHTTLPVK